MSVSREEIKKYYSNVTVKEQGEMTTHTCACGPECMPAYIRKILTDIPEEITTRFYGCGSPLPAALEGCTVLDLGCGTGRDVYLASKLVGPTGKVIGVDTDQSAVIDGGYGEGMTVTSAMKGLAPTTIDTLTDVIVNGNWANYAGKIETLGLVSADDPSANYVQLPLETTQWADGKFTVEDYTALVADMFNGKVKVSNDTTVEPTVSNIAVNYLGNIKG